MGATAGTPIPGIHHIAWRTPSAESQLEWRRKRSEARLPLLRRPAAIR